MRERRVLVGRFGAAHGVKGELRLQSFTAEPKAIASYGPLSDASGVRRYALRSLRHLKDNLFVARIEGVNDRTSAERLTNIELYVPRAALPRADEDEFYLADLIGLAVLDETRAPIGRIKDVLDFGGGDILEVAPEKGGETLLFPFTRDIVPEIDVEGGFVVVRPPVEIEAGEGASLDPQDKS